MYYILCRSIKHPNEHITANNCLLRILIKGMTALILLHVQWNNHYHIYDIGISSVTISITCNVTDYI